MLCLTAMGHLLDRKYGTGPNSIHRLEAPRAKPGARATSSERAITFRQRAEQPPLRMLHYTCCARQRLANHRAVLLVGCSQLEALFDHLCDGKAQRGFARSTSSLEACQATRTVLVLVVSAGKWARNFPSHHRADVALTALPAAVAKPSAVVTNFAAAHFLHVHPVRPFFDADDNSRPGCYPQSTCADYRGLEPLLSGSWMTSDAAAYRRALGARVSLVFMTPNWICDAKLYKQYQRVLALPLPARTAKCLDWVSRRRGHRPADGGRAFCEQYTFTGAGSIRLAESIRAWGRRLNASLLRANALTRDRCNETGDARHYPKRVPAQIAELETLLSAKR